MLWCWNISSVLWLYQYVSIPWKQLNITQLLLKALFSMRYFVIFFFNKDEILLSPPSHYYQEGITEKILRSGPSCQGVQEPEMLATPWRLVFRAWWWHPQISQPGQASTSHITQGIIPAVQASKRDACASRDAMAQQTHTGVQATHGTRPHNQSSRGSAWEWQDLQKGRMTFSRESGTSWWYSG